MQIKAIGEWCGTVATLAVLTGCGADEAVNPSRDVATSIARTAPTEQTAFSYEADIELVMDGTDPALDSPIVERGHRAAPESDSRTQALQPAGSSKPRSFEYHLAYSDSGGRITVELSPSRGRRSTMLASETSIDLIWQRLEKVRWTTETENAEFTLRGGRRIVADASGQDLAPLRRTAVAHAGKKTRNQAQRRARLISVIAPFVRVEGSIAGVSNSDVGAPPPINRDSSSIWTTTPGGVRILTHREFRPTSGADSRARATTVTVRNATVHGTPTLQP